MGIHQCSGAPPRWTDWGFSFLVQARYLVRLGLEHWPIGLFGVETLSWYRLIGFGAKPVYTVARRGLEVSAPIQHSADGSMVELRLKSGDHRYELAVAPQTYNAIVSWVESGPPIGRA